MLLKNKNKLTVTEEKLQSSLNSSEGRELVRLNLRYPRIKGSDRHPLMRNAAPFYVRTAQNLTLFAKSELLPLAEKESKAPDFLPFGVVTDWQKTFENEKYLSLLLFISVFDGKNTPRTEPLTQVWEKKFGLKCPFSYFFRPEAKKRLPRLPDLESEGCFEKELFVLREGGFEFFVRLPDKKTVFLPIEELKEKNLLKISV